MRDIRATRVGHVALLFIILNDAVIDSLVKHIDLRRGEFSGTHTALEQEIKLGKCATLRLRDAEIGVYDTEETDASLIVG